MDSGQFDELARQFGRLQSRRSFGKLLAGLGAGLATSLFSDQASARQRCRVAGEICRKKGDCCNNTCGTPDATGRRRCGCQNNGDCPAEANPCLQATCANGACSSIPRTEQSCGDFCSGAGTCDQSGTCVAGSPVQCGDCQKCDNDLAQCVPDPDAASQGCDTGNLCVTGGICQSDGTCGGTPTQCGQCRTCDPQTGSCIADAQQFNQPCSLTDTCTVNNVCQEDGTCGGGSLGTVTVSGGTTASSALGMDDRLDVYINNSLSIQRTLNAAPFTISVQNGDTVEFVGVNETTPCVVISSLYLHCGEHYQTIDATGFPAQCNTTIGNTLGEFYRTGAITVAL